LLVETLGIFCVVTGAFGTPEAGGKASKKLGFNARKGAEDTRVHTDVFTSLESAEEAGHGFLLLLNMATIQKSNRTVHNKKPWLEPGLLF